jgi:hypothetical protein
VKKWRRRFQQRRIDLFDDPMSRRSLMNDFGEAIGSMLTKKLFSSCKVFFRTFRIGKTPYLWVLHNKLV